MRVLVFLLFVGFVTNTNGQEKLIKLQGQFLRISFIDTSIKLPNDLGLFFVPTRSKTIDIESLLKAKLIYYLDLGLPLSDKIDSLQYTQSLTAQLKTVYKHGETFYDSVRIKIAKGVMRAIDAKNSIISKNYFPRERDFRLVLGGQEFYIRPKTVTESLIDIR